MFRTGVAAAMASSAGPLPFSVSPALRFEVRNLSTSAHAVTGHAMLVLGWSLQHTSICEHLIGTWPLHWCVDKQRSQHRVVAEGCPSTAARLFAASWTAQHSAQV